MATFTISFAGFVGLAATLLLNTNVALAQVSVAPQMLPESPRKQPILPWIDPEQMEYFDLASHYWNSRYRGGRLGIGAVAEYMEFETVGDKTATFNGGPHPYLNAGKVKELHGSLAFGLVLYESLRLTVGLGTSLTNFAPNPNNQDIGQRRTGFDRYGWGVNYLAQLQWAPVFEFLPTMVTPEFTAAIRYHNGKNLEGLGAWTAMQLRFTMLINAEFFADKKEGAALNGYVGVGYQHYFGELGYLRGPNLKFSAEGGGGSALGIADIEFIAGLHAVLADTFLIRGEFRTGTFAFNLSLELIYD